MQVSSCVCTFVYKYTGGQLQSARLWWESSPSRWKLSRALQWIMEVQRTTIIGVPWQSVETAEGYLVPNPFLSLLLWDPLLLLALPFNNFKELLIWICFLCCRRKALAEAFCPKLECDAPLEGSSLDASRKTILTICKIQQVIWSTSAQCRKQMENHDKRKLWISWLSY